jgi:phenylalanine-4-hydroxylase
MFKVLTSTLTYTYIYIYIHSVTDYPITTYQPTYFVAEDLEDAKEKLINFTKELPKPFYAR